MLTLARKVLGHAGRQATLAALIFGWVSLPGPLAVANNDRERTVDLIDAPRDCLEKANGTRWTEPERAAWRQICAGDAVDLRNASSKNFGSNKSRRLGQVFIEQIFEQKDLAQFTNHRAIELVGAILPSVRLNGVSLTSLKLTNCTVEGAINLQNIEVKHELSIEDSSFASIALSFLIGGSVTIRGDVEGGSDQNKSALFAKELNLDRLAVAYSRVDNITIWNSSVKNLISVAGSVRKMDVRNTHSGGLILVCGAVGEVWIRNLDDVGAFYLRVGSWSESPLFKVENATSGRFTFLLPRSAMVPIEITNFNFSSASWGPDPMTVLRLLERQKTEPPMDLYTKVAKSYADVGEEGLALDILVAREDARARQSPSLIYRGVSLLFRTFCGYGYHPEYGFLWVAGFVAAGSIIFWSGRRMVIGDYLPRNWLVFSIDAVLPGIELEKRHKEVEFRGWRQYYLYFVKFLSAVIVVLALQLIQRALFD